MLVERTALAVRAKFSLYVSSSTAPFSMNLMYSYIWELLHKAEVLNPGYIVKSSGKLYKITDDEVPSPEILVQLVWVAAWALGVF